MEGSRRKEEKRREKITGERGGDEVASSSFRTWLRP